MPPGLEPFPLTAAILAIVAVIVFPVVRAYQASQEARIKREAEVSTQAIAQKDKEIARLDQQLAQTMQERDHFIDLATYHAEAAREATAATDLVVTRAERVAARRPGR